MPLSESEELELLQLQKQKAMFGASSPAQPPAADSQEIASKVMIPPAWIGAAQAATLNHVPQIVGGVTHPVGAIKALMGQGQEDPDVQNYEKNRDVTKKVLDAVQQAHPYQFGAGQVGGFIAGPGKLLNGLTGAKALAAAGALGAGAAEGNSVGNYSTKDYGKIAKDAVGGLLTGAAAQQASEIAQPVLSKVGSYIADKLKNTGIAAAASHLQPSSAIRSEVGRQGVNDAAEAALESKAIKPFSKVGSTADNLNELAPNPSTLPNSGMVKGPIKNFPASPESSLYPSDEIPASSDLLNAKKMANQAADAGSSPMSHAIDAGGIVAAVTSAAHGNLYPAVAMAVRMATKGRVASTVAAGSYGAGKALGSANLNPVANAIAARSGQAVTQKILQDPEVLRQNLIDQQTRRDSQQALKDSQD